MCARHHALLLLGLVQPLILSACLSQGHSIPREPTLLDLGSEPPQGAAMPHQTSESEAAQLYREALEVTDDPDIRLHLSHRLADLESRQYEAGLIDGKGLYNFDKAIARYELILASQSDNTSKDEILYQLAMIYELNGSIERSLAILDQLVRQYPDSAHIAEAQFRRGEILFSQQQYGEAQLAYSGVLDAGETTPFYQDALYMLGWAQFKQDAFPACLISFTEILDRLIPADGTLDKLDRPDTEMVQDSLRVVSLVFSYQGGAAAIEKAFALLALDGKRRYHHLLYESLASFYLEKRRYRDAAETYEHFIKHYPSSPYSVSFSLKVVETYEQAEFPSLAITAKQQFVDDFGINSNYWQDSNDAIHNTLRPHLRQYLEDLATYEHASGQALLKQQQKQELKHGQGSVDSSAQEAFKRAGLWYQQFATTFADDASTPEMVFLMGESLNEAGEFTEAITAYERVAYGYEDAQQGAEAGYAAVMVYDKIIAEADEQDASIWRNRKIRSAIQFAGTYPDDVRSVGVLAQAARELLTLEKRSEAIALAEMISDWQPTPAVEWQITGWLVQAQALFELEDYSAAEHAYAKALDVMPEDDPDHSGVVERLAASVYKDGEQQLQSDNTDAAVSSLLRVATVAPASPIAAQAQYDAAALLLKTESWPEAEQVLVDFRQQYPEHDLAGDIPSKLVEAYLQQDKFAAAAGEYSLISEADEDPDARRLSLYLAAELFQKSGQTDAAIDHYTRYAEQYPLPYEALAEAQFQLAELYAESGDEEERRVWLGLLVDANAQKPDQATNRTQYLAATAAAVFADDAYQTFSRSTLTLPLRQSLQTKTATLKKALSAYEQLLDYEIAEFVSLSNYRIGQMYVQLSEDLMASDRPTSLNPLELEQYELMLEELVYPFEESAIKIHETNTRRVLTGLYDQWVRKSFASLAVLLPVRYDKHEKTVLYARELRQ